MTKAKPARDGKWWVVQQHDRFTVEEADTRPTTKVEKGQRMKAVHGPYASKEAAQERADMLESRTLRAMAGRE